TWVVTSYDGYGREETESKIEAPGPIAHPVCAADYAMRAVLREAEGDMDNAIADYEKAVELQPEHSRAWLSLSRLRQRKEDQQGAVRDATRAIEEAPGFAEALAFRGYCLSQLDDFAAAEEDLRVAIELEPEWASSWSIQGDLKLRQK